jgi:hypothetical protein
MPHEVVFHGLVMPTLLPLFLVCILLQWGIDKLLVRIGGYRRVWHPALLRLSLFVCLFGILGLLIYR